MSRFFHAGDSSSESSSSDEEELYSGEEAEKKSEDESSAEEEASDEEDSSSSSDEGGKTGANRFMRDAVEESEDEDEDKVTIVKSAKDKRLEELEGTTRLIENAEKINDWAVISTEFDKLNRQIVKAQVGPMPKMYIKAIADLEDFMNETIAKQKVSTKKMNATNARGLNAVKQRIKKNNKDYATEIDKYREDKVDYMMSEEEEEVGPVEKTKKPKTVYIDGIDGGDDEGFSTVGKG
ncbi:MAG: Translation initiation factor 3 subunit c, partial [Pleopsidium flavum]